MTLNHLIEFAISASLLVDSEAAKSRHRSEMTEALAHELSNFRFAVRGALHQPIPVADSSKDLEGAYEAIQLVHRVREGVESVEELQAYALAVRSWSYIFQESAPLETLDENDQSIATIIYSLEDQIWQADPEFYNDTKKEIYLLRVYAMHTRKKDFRRNVERWAETGRAVVKTSHGKAAFKIALRGFLRSMGVTASESSRTNLDGESSREGKIADGQRSGTGKTGRKAPTLVWDEECLELLIRAKMDRLPVRDIASKLQKKLNDESIHKKAVEARWYYLLRRYATGDIFAQSTARLLSEYHEAMKALHDNVVNEIKQLKGPSWNSLLRSLEGKYGYKNLSYRSFDACFKSPGHTWIHETQTCRYANLPASSSNMALSRALNAESSYPSNGGRSTSRIRSPSEEDCTHRSKRCKAGTDKRFEEWISYTPDSLQG
jgi:hypothetical protein